MMYKKGIIWVSCVLIGVSVLCNHVITYVEGTKITLYEPQNILLYNSETLLTVITHIPTTTFTWATSNTIEPEMFHAHKAWFAIYVIIALSFILSTVVLSITTLTNIVYYSSLSKRKKTWKRPYTFHALKTWFTI